MARAYRKKLRNCGFWLAACDRPRWKGLPFRWQCGNVLRPTSTKARIHYYYHRKAKLRWCDGRAGCFRVGCHGNALGQPRGAAWNIHPLASFPRFSLLPPRSLPLSPPLSSRALKLSRSLAEPLFQLARLLHPSLARIRLSPHLTLAPVTAPAPSSPSDPSLLLSTSSPPPFAPATRFPRYRCLSNRPTLLLSPTSFPRLRYFV